MDEKQSLWLEHFRNRKANVMDHELYNEFAILVPLVEKREELHFVFEVRAQNIRQPGEICFPGGKIDNTDSSPAHAALRELEEELGVPPSKVRLAGDLDYMITPFRFMLYPFLGLIDSDTVFKKNDDEVKEILFVPLSKLLEMKPKEHKIFLNVEPDEEFPFHLIPNGENYNWRTAFVNEQFYEYEGNVIWGLTARILTHVLQEIKGVKK
ncbi:NUDIX hydrolase [Evansella clarkii]|uniref:NUDIX hydrolase n=1 Tax=Evansella clarkii TaxID=79879 RepID=UPI0009986477|nr:CoA pyrophosphatase [Evansella clarkii]